MPEVTVHDFTRSQYMARTVVVSISVIRDFMTATKHSRLPIASLNAIMDKDSLAQSGCVIEWAGRLFIIHPIGYRELTIERYTRYALMTADDKDGFVLELMQGES